MVKGFKKDGKFHPTEKSTKKLSSDQVLGEKGRIKTIPEQKIRVFKFEELDSDVQERILEKERNFIAEFADDFFAQDEGVVFDENEKKDAHDIGLGNVFPKFYEVGGNRGNDFVQFEFEIKDKKKFHDYLGLSDSLLKKVDVDFHNEGEVNTQLEFTDINGSRIDLAPDIHSGDEHYSDGDFDKEDIPTLDEVKQMLHAFDKFDDLMTDSLRHLTRNYESQFEEDTIKENLDANEREFEKDGTPA